MDNVSITPHEFDTYLHVKCTFSIIILAICGSPLLTVSALVSALKTETMTGRVPSSCSGTQFELGRNIEREHELEGAKSESLDRDLPQPRFASLESERLRLRP